MHKKIIIGTRGSELALWQSRWVKQALLERYDQLEIELKIVQTKGDVILDVALSKIGDKGLFTKELEQKLLSGEIDLAVHSLKDMPTVWPEGLCIGAITSREDPADVLISRDGLTLEQLPFGAKLFSGSLRRKAQVLHYRNDIVVEDIRGNVQTRLRKFDESDADAMIMASAGLKRLGLADRISERLNPEVFVPACGQGALAVQICCDDAETAEIISVLDDPVGGAAVVAERTVLGQLEGGCQIPIGAYGQIRGNKIYLRAIIASLAGDKLITAEGHGDIGAPEKLGQLIAEELLEKGGKEILAQIFRETSGH
ncbi:MAG: hydroxymethylbilane synthase [Phycisphaerae bacterium]|nr:hydroxymethylbilane synthase [Phycisphaerae bacterium]